LLGLAGFCSLAKSSPAQAAFDNSDGGSPAAPALPEFIVSVSNTGALSVIDTRTDVVYGPFLAGELGSE